MVSTRVSFKPANAKMSSIKLPSIQQQLAVVNNAALRQVYLSQKSVSTAQKLGKGLASEKSSVFK